MSLTAAIATAEARLSDVHATYRVTLTNGSGTKELALAGTQQTVWTWCCRAGETPTSDLAGYVPVDIEPARPTIAQTLAACTCGARESFSVLCPVHGI
jgi:hypothetical protein